MIYLLFVNVDLKLSASVRLLPLFLLTVPSSYLVEDGMLCMLLVIVAARLLFWKLKLYFCLFL